MSIKDVIDAGDRMGKITLNIWQFYLVATILVGVGLLIGHYVW